MKIHFIRGKIDLQNLRGADALVCPTNSTFFGTGALETAIREAAGPELTPALLRERAKELAQFPGKQLKSGDILVTEGFRLKNLQILHLAVPMFPQAAQDPACLKIACHRLFSLASILGIRRLALTLPGVGGAGWPYASSMKTLWQTILECLDPRKGDPSSVKVLDLYYLAEASNVVDAYHGRTSQAFFNLPSKWGTRGDLYLWGIMMAHFDDPKFNCITPGDFVQEIQRFFHLNTGKWLCGDTSTYLTKLLPGATISGDFAQVFVPLLVSNLTQLEYAAPREPTFLVPIDLVWGHSHKLTEPLKLPYELLPLLSHLRSPRERMNESIRYNLDIKNLYFITVYHHKYFPDLIDYYTLDVEDAQDRHYRFDETAAQALIQHFHEHPKALIRGMMDYLKEHGGKELERVVSAVSGETFSY